MNWIESFEDNPDYWFDGRNYDKPVYLCSDDKNLIIYCNNLCEERYVVHSFVTGDGDSYLSLEEAKSNAVKFM